MENLTKETFKAKVFDYETRREWSFSGGRPCIVDFYADWCGPCRLMSPVIEGLARKYEGKVDFYKIDMEREPELGVLFGVQSIPTLLFIPKDGQPKVAIGALPRRTMVDAIEQVLKVPG